MSHEPAPTDKKLTAEPPQGTYATYIAGFVLSVVLTVMAYTIVVERTLDSNLLVGAIIALAVAQFLVQVVFFLHLGRESKPRWNLMVFGFMLLVLFILVLGTLWIMENLDYHMPAGEELEQQIIEDEGYR
jgi:cytochrome o ubiquinol oxidase subunit IV